jgi:aspartyl-tRNA(Asn)/glutamyl-tRNA(Gln) amidotransferase subunit A
MTSIADLPAAMLNDAYRRGRLSPLEVARDVLARIEANAAFNAFLPIRPEPALAAAAASEKRWRDKAPLGAADGLPATIKDNLWQQGELTRRGSRTGEPEPEVADAPAVARLREQGAVFIAKTTLPEYGWIGACHSPLTGITRNPWNPAHTPGGSTGGGAVAALLGLGVLHLGTDGAGSLRIPASFTGVFGFKPSYGRVPAFPPSPFNVLAHQGPIAKHVADAALMLSVISGPDVRDMTAWNTPAEDFTAGLDAGVRGLRVALSPRFSGAAKPDADIEAAVRKAARVLEEQGAVVEEAEPPVAGAVEIIRGLWWPGATAIVDSIAPAQRALMDPGLLAMAERGRRFTVSDYLAAHTRRNELHGAMLRFHECYDLLLTPTMPMTALKVGLEAPDEGTWGDDWTSWSPYTYPFNLTQQPACSVPGGLASTDLPMGVQIVGPPRDDRLVLRAARVIEQAMPMPALDQKSK